MKRKTIATLSVLGLVIAMTVVLAIVGWCNYGNQGQQRKLNDERIKALVTLRMVLMNHAREHGQYPDDLAALEHADDLPENFAIPADVTYHVAGAPFRQESTRTDQDALDRLHKKFHNAILLFEDSRDDSYGKLVQGRYLLFDTSDPEWLPLRDVPDRSGFMPLHRAALSGNKILAKRLLERGADVNMKDRWGRMPLHLAAGSVQTELAALLLENGADINAPDQNGMTALYTALTNANVELENRLALAKVLLTAGAEMDIFSAAVYGDAERVRALLEKDPELVNARGPYRMTPLSHAVAYRKKDVAEILLDSGADINARDAGGGVAVVAAASNDHDALVELLRRKTTDADIFTASALGMTDRVKELLTEDRALACASTDYPGNTPLHNAAMLGQLDVMRILLDNGALIEVPNGCGNAALIEAAKNGRAEAVEFLLANNADIDANAKGTLDRRDTALTVSIRWKHFEVAKLLIEKGADVNAPEGGYAIPLQAAASEDDAELVKLLLAKGADVNGKTMYGWNALQWASSREIAEILIAHGADLNAKARYGDTPLLFAIGAGKLAKVKLLLDSGADILTEDFYEEALYKAAHGCNLDIWNLLRRRKGMSTGSKPQPQR